MTQSIAHQSVRYLCVGLLVYAADFVTYVILLSVSSAAYLGANVAGKSVGAAIGFILHKRFTFSWEQRDHLAHQAISYGIMFAANVAVSNLLLWLMVGRFEANAVLARLATDMVVIAMSFLLGRYWVYRSA